MQQAGPQTLARLVAEAFLGLAVGPIAGAGQGIGTVLLEGVARGLGVLGVLEVAEQAVDLGIDSLALGHAGSVPPSSAACHRTACRRRS